MNSDVQPANPNGPGGAAVDIHEPFTTAERIHQLSEIDTDIATLLEQTSSALRSIVQPPPAAPSESDDEPLHQRAAAENPALADFTAIQDSFLTTLDRIDKHLKRQIYALEEAGIITLRGGPSDQQPGAVAGVADGGGDGQVGGRTKGITARLEPDGVGRYGTLDVGRLNMASSTVERDMEGELWRRAREHLEGVSARREGGGVGGGDQEMMG
ncbi:mediator complex protein-domain-containing protein [Podospora appendiculata]|uniref:Mediator of RNA polymerase II transcription subunit 11 n=1 Tax=Podospora appendiculata TaxID=314037 RepID=A0AAE0X635_9PEZI|nr:mediator complex protein-domain-containing protein [Podospora appendiculata]